MTDGIDFELTGLPELRGKLQELSSDIEKKGGRFALRKAAQKLVAQAKANAQRIDDPETRENIADNIVERWDGRLYKRTGDLGFRVGVLGGAGGSASGSSLDGLPGGDTRQAFRQQEFGNSNHAAQPFMRPAMQQAGQDVVNEFVKQYDKAASRALKRARKSA